MLPQYAARCFRVRHFRMGPNSLLGGCGLGLAQRRAEKAGASTNDCKQLFSDAAPTLNRAVEMGP